MTDESDMVPCEVCGELILPARAVWMLYAGGHWKKITGIGSDLHPDAKPFGKTCAKNALADG